MYSTPTRLKDGPCFIDRGDAGRRLAQELEDYRSERPIVVGIARGGLPIAAEIAAALEAEFTALLVRRLHPGDDDAPTLGAVVADGTTFVRDDVVETLGMPDTVLDGVIRAELALAKQEALAIDGEHARPTFAGRTILLVDDRIVTGASMRAAMRAVTRDGAANVVIAVPVGNEEVCTELRREGHTVVCPVPCHRFAAIGAYYESFEDIELAEAHRIATQACERSAAKNLRTKRAAIAPPPSAAA